MRKFCMVLGVLVMLFGLSIMLTPLRSYFLIGWITGCVLLCNGLSTFFAGFRKKGRSLNKIIVGLITTGIGLLLLFTDMQQTLTQVVIVYLVAGGILISGLIELILGYALIKKEKKGLTTLIFGLISFSIGLMGLIFQNTTVLVVGALVGYHLIRIGMTIFSTAKDWYKPHVIGVSKSGF